MTTPPLDCNQAHAALDALRQDIADNGPDALRTLLAQTDALLARSPHWTKCQRAARYRTLLAIHSASRQPSPRSAGVPPASSPSAFSDHPSSLPPPPSSLLFDLVVPLGPGSTHNDLELRYLLRSALANLSVSPWDRGAPAPPLPPPGLRLIHIIGPRRPKWLLDHPMLRFHPWKPIRPKNHDIVAKFLHAANHPDVAEHFLAACDDFLFLSPILPATGPLPSPATGHGPQATPYSALQRGGVLSTHANQGYWKKAQAETRQLLAAAGKPVLFYDYHVPTLQTKAGWLQVDREIPWRNHPGHAVWSLYHNVAGTHGPVLSGDLSGGYHAGDGSRHPASLEEIDRLADGKLFLNYNDGGLKGTVLHDWLSNRYPAPAPWETPAPLPLASSAGVPCPVSGSAGVPPALGSRSPSSASPTSAFSSHPSSLPPSFPHDLDILVVLYGRSLPRAAAVAKTFARWHQLQQPMPRVLCAWCYREGEAPGDLANLPEYPWLHRVPLPQYDIEDGVFRKEGLLNYLLRDHATAPYILTLDADVWTPAKGWFRSIRDKLAQHPDHVLQPFRYFKDTKENVSAYSWSAQTLPAMDPAKCKHPGLGWAFTRAWADSHGAHAVFNPWHPIAMGDWAMIREHRLGREKEIDEEYFLRVQRRGLPAGILAAIEAKVWHENHTVVESVPEQYRSQRFADRGYKWGCKSLARLGQLEQYLRLDDKGVPLLRDLDSPFARFLSRKAELQSEESANLVLLECFGPNQEAGSSGLREPFVLETLPGIGDHVMLVGVVNHLHRARPGAEISVRLTCSGLEPWFQAVCPAVRFTRRKGQQLRWRSLVPPPGQHMVTAYGAKDQDIVLPVRRRETGAEGLRIAFVGGHNEHLPLKTWPHWSRLADLVRARYGVDPLWVGRDLKADPLHTLPDMLASMDAIICTEGMASHVAWAIRKRATVLVSGALDPTALAYPGWHTILQGACPWGRHCHRYTKNSEGPACRAECMGDVRPEAVLETIMPRRRMVNVHFLGRNCGDANCGVARYFPGIEERSSNQPAVPCDIAIFGGGGIFQECMRECAARYRALGARIAIWGAGIVTEDRAKGVTPFNWRAFGDMADFCGLREDSPWEYAPCPSCMSGLFDVYGRTPALNDVVYYNHPDKPVRAGGPRMTNYDTIDLESVLKFLSSGRKVVTSSYHGRIWATWLGREVELDGPAAAQLALSGPVPPLEEARTRSQAVWQTVRRLA